MPQEVEQSNCAGGRCREILSTVSSEVLETMFFTDASPIDCEHSWLSPALSARVAFQGSHVGAMCVAVSREAVESIAAAFLGADLADIGDVEQGEVILELANILCGSVLSRLWPESSLLLGAPRLENSEPDLDNPLHCCLSLPEGCISISVQWSETPES